MNSPISIYEKQQSKRVLNENSTIPIREKESSKYKRIRQKVLERPHSQISGKEVEKLIEKYERNGHNYQTKSSDLAQTFNLSLKDPYPGKYRRQQKRFTERSNSQPVCEETEKHVKSVELKINNLSFYNSQYIDQNYSPPITRENLKEFGKEEIPSREKTYSKNIKHKSEIYPFETQKQSNSKSLNCDILGLEKNPGQSTSEKKYKRSQRCVTERSFSQPSLKETEKYLKTSKTLKNSTFLESNFRHFNLDHGEKSPKEIRRINPEKYQRNSQFTKKPFSQTFHTRIKEFIEILEPQTKCFYGEDLYLGEFDNQKRDLRKCDRRIDSTEYEGNKSNSADKYSSQFLKTHAANFVVPDEDDNQVALRKNEEFEKHKFENSKPKFKQISERYSRSHVRNIRSASAPPVFVQTNVPNYFEYSKIDKEIKDTEESLSGELKCHETPKCQPANTSNLLDIKYKDEHLTMPGQKQSHLRSKEDKYFIPGFLVLESKCNKRPNKKADEDIADGGTVENSTALKSEKYSRINKQNKREKRFDSSEILHKTTNIHLGKTQMESRSSRELEEMPVNSISEKIPKKIKVDQNNNKTNQLLMDNVQTNAPLYHLKLFYDRKRSAAKEKEHNEFSKIRNGYTNNMHYYSLSDSLSSCDNLENEILANKKYVFEQKETQNHFEQFKKQMIPATDSITQSLLKNKRSFVAYQNLETNINSKVSDSSELSSDKNSFHIVAGRNRNHSNEKSAENPGLSTHGMSTQVRARNGQKQSSEIGKGSAELDWSISEISVIENEGGDNKLFGIRGDGTTLLLPVEKKSSGDEHKISGKFLSNSFGDFSKELKRTFSPSQLNKNSPNVNKKLEFLSKENAIDGVKCRLMLRKYFFLWKKKWRKYLAAKILWKRHSLQKGINALRQASQNSQIVSEVLQERIKKVWLRSCFQKWKQEASIKLGEQLAAAFKKWKENAKEQKRFQTLKDIHHKNVLLLCFHKWRSHYKSNIMLLRALTHHRMFLLSNMWHHWIQFVKQNQQKKFWQILARKFQRKILQNKTMKTLTSVYKNLVKAKLHYRSQKMRMVLQFWQKGAAISSHQSEQIVSAVQSCSNQLVLRRTLDIWVHQLWLICESRRADRWILSRYWSVWHKKWCCIVAWRQTVVAKIEHQHTRTILYKWQKNVHLQKQRHQLATKQVQKVLLMQLLTKWKRLAKRQVETRQHRQIQVSNGQYQLKYQFFLIWKDKLQAKQKARQIYCLWSEQCVRKAVNRWKDSHNQATTNKKAFQFEPMRNLLIQKGVFWRWKRAWQKVNEEETVAQQCRAILQQQVLRAIFQKWHSRTQSTLAVKPLVQRWRSQLLLHVFRAWHCFLLEKHQRSKNCLQLQNYHLRQLFHKWRNLFILREKETSLSIHHCHRFLRKCVLGWRLVIQRKNKAEHFHQSLLLQRFFSWREKTTHSLRCKAMKEAVQHSCRTVQRHFFNQWRQNAIQQKIHQKKSIQHIEKTHRHNVLTQALASWRHLLKIQVIARNHYKNRLAIWMQQILVKWHSFAKSTSCLAVRCLQRRLHLDAWTKCPHTSRDHTCCWQQENILQENGSTGEDVQNSQTTGTDKESLEDIGLRNQKVMTRMILHLKYWPVSIAYLQWRHYTQLCLQLKTRQQQLHVKHITAVLSTTFGLWRQQQQAFKLARHHQELILMKKIFRELWNYAVNRRSKKALLAQAKKHHHATVFHICFPIWQKKVKQKQYWDKVAKLLHHCMPEEQLLQPLEFQLTSLLGQRSLHACFHIWQETYREASFYRQHYHQLLLIRYLHIWRSWALYRRHLSQKCHVFRKRRIQLLALQLWIRRLRQKRWIQENQRQKVNIVLLTVLRQWHDWSSKSCRQKTAEAKVKHNHVTLMLSQVFTSLTGEFHKIKTACQWYQNKLIIKVIAAWFCRSRFQINERVKVKKFQQKKNKAVMQRILKTWKHAYQLRCEAKFNREQRIHLKVCRIAECWQKKAKKSRGKILETVFTERVVRFCFVVWRNRFAMMKQLKERLDVYASWKQQQTQTHLFTRWRSTLLITRADQTYKSKLITKVFSSWQMYTKASLLYERRFQEYQTIQQKRQLKSTFRNWKIRWQHKQISTNLFKHKIKTRVLKAWYDYVQGQVRLTILRAYLTDRISTRHLLSAYHKWKGRVTSCVNERRKEKQQAILAVQHYRTRLSMTYFLIWRQETLISRCIVRRRMHLANKYCNRWKYHTDLSYTASLWHEKQIYYRIWCKWRAAFIQEKTATVMEAEFRRQNLRQMFRIWYQYCRYKKIHEKEKLFPGICFDLENI